MKASFLALFMVFAIPSPEACAQNRVEISVGLNHASLENSNDRFLGNIAGANWRTAMSAGIRYTIPYHKWRFGTGLGFSIKGEKGYLEKKHSRPYYVADIKYMEVPLTVTKVIGDKFLISAGIYGAYAFQRQIKGYVTNDPVRKSHRPYRPIDMGTQAGIAYRFCRQWTIGLSYGFSFLDIEIEPRYNRWFNLHVGYALFYK